MAMDADAIEGSLRTYIARHKAEFQELPTIQSQLLELATLVLVAEHYRIAGYVIGAENLKEGRFRVKRTSAGYQWRFSWFRATRGSTEVEIHTNLRVAGAYGKDEGVYVVDVAVCNPNVVPRTDQAKKTWVALSNKDLITWVEAKKLVVYPMLLAQFIGIVHELSPACLNGPKSKGFQEGGHFPPALVTTGNFTRGCAQIRAGFADRGFRVAVVRNLDVALAALNKPCVESPFVEPWASLSGSSQLRSLQNG
jgi:hypothetical protein